METSTDSTSPVDKSSSLYDQKEKAEVRKKAIVHAVRNLTTERSTSTCVQRNYPRDLWNQLLEVKDNYLSSVAIESMDKDLVQWELFHDSSILTKRPSDLRALCLSGDDLTKDIEVLIDNGVCSQNVWMFEKDPKIFEKAKEALRKSGYRQVKLIYTDLLKFLQDKNPFDIIYYDACGSLPSVRQKTPKIIGSIFELNKLSSPGALITNFSFPPKQSQCEERKQIAYVAKEYLKYKREDITGYCNETILNQRTDEQNYSEYVTIQVIDSASLLIPAQRMLLSSKWNQVFTPAKTFFEEVNKHPPYSIDSTSEVADGCADKDAGVHRNMGFEAGEAIYNSFYLSKIGIAMETEKKTNLLCKAWVNEVFFGLSGDSQKQNVCSLLLTALLFSSFHFFSKFANGNFKECIQALKSSEDEMLIAGLLYGQSAEPSYPVLDKLLRLEYTAKEQQMFCDVFVFDRCRYLFDSFPIVYTVGQFCEAKANNSLISNDFLILKMVLDGLKKHLNCISKKDLFKVDLQSQFGKEMTVSYYNFTLLNTPFATSSPASLVNSTLEFHDSF